jgi:hypothetical protein
MQSEVQAAGAGVKLARGAFFPDLQLVGQYDSRGSTQGSFFGEWAMGAAVSFPLFQGGVRINELERARAERESAERQLELMQLRIAERVDRALASLREADARSASLRSAVEQYAEVARAEKLALDTGAGTQTDYLTAHADLLSARAQLAGDGHEPNHRVGGAGPRHRSAQPRLGPGQPGERIMKMPKKRLVAPAVLVLAAALVLILVSVDGDPPNTLHASGTVEGTEALVGFTTRRADR